MPRLVISASRRTDIPAFYMPWFMSGLEEGRFEVVNPYNRRISVVPASPDQVHSIVFWSKDFGPFLRHGYGRQLERRGYRLFFNFCVNSPHPALEPGLPPLEERLHQMAWLSRDHGPRTIQWRFDPICFFKTHGGMENNLGHFHAIAESVSRAGVSTCITSFLDHYAKILRRVRDERDFAWIDPPLETKLEVVDRLAADLAALEIELRLCCEQAVLDALPADLPVRGASCIPNELLAELYGPDIRLANDPGQRRAAGCNCRVSRDIGSYALHPCRHDCLYCYANPCMDRAGGAIHKATSPAETTSTTRRRMNR